MTIYLASFDLRAIGHNYSALYAELKALGAHQAQATAWLIESDAPMGGLNQSLLGMLAQSDSLLLVAVSATTLWAATRLSNFTGEWLKSSRP